MRSFLTLFIFCLCPAAFGQTAENDRLLSSMLKELDRSFKALKDAEKPSLYYLAYEVEDNQETYLSALLGAVRYDSDTHTRQLTVDARVGDRRLDSTHQIKGMEGWYSWDQGQNTRIATDDDEASVRAGLWLATDKTAKEARERFTKVLTNKAVTAEEEDKSDDFSVETPSRHYDRADHPKVDKAAWRARVSKLSSALKKYPFIIDCGVNFGAETVNRYMLNSEGGQVVTGNRYIRLSYHLTARTTDGMDLQRYESYDADRIEDLPSDETVLKDMERSAGELEALTRAPLVEPYTGPAIFKARAAGVYFHEILGHRLEGHRQKLEEEGQTFTKKLGLPITADFISVYDDAPRHDAHGHFLRGFYRFDDEGMPSRRVVLVEKGVLKGFLTYRSPINNFPNSNGHGRRQAGHQIVARMGNTMIEASKAVPYPRLREMLIEEIKKQKKPYGLVFDDISGGFTMTGRFFTQSFKVIPLLVYRVYPDGRPDEVVRGVDIVGTPLTSFTKIIAASDDYDVFNGTCGAESGGVPVSGVAPSLLFSEVEVEKKLKFSEKPPILPPPHHDNGGKR